MGERVESVKKEEGREIEILFIFLSLLSKIYENWTVGFRQNKRQSSSTHRELRMGTKILEFRLTQRGREISYLGYF